MTAALAVLALLALAVLVLPFALYVAWHFFQGVNVVFGGLPFRAARTGAGAVLRVVGRVFALYERATTGKPLVPDAESTSEPTTTGQRLAFLFLVVVIIVVLSFAANT